MPLISYMQSCVCNRINAGHTHMLFCLRFSIAWIVARSLTMLKGDTIFEVHASRHIGYCTLSKANYVINNRSIPVKKASSSTLHLLFIKGYTARSFDDYKDDQDAGCVSADNKAATLKISC